MSGFMGGGLAGGLASGIQQGMAVSNFMKEQAIESQVADTSKRTLEEVAGENGAPSKWKFGDTTYDTKPEAYTLDLQRSNDIAKLYETNGKAREAIALRAAANQNHKLARESAMEKEIQEAFQGSSFAQLQGKVAQDDAAYQSQLAQYKTGLADGSIAAGTPAPTLPIKQSPTTLDWMTAAANTAAIRAKHGALNPQEMLNFAKGVEDLKAEGTAKTLTALHAGDVSAAVQAFNSQGNTKVDPSMVTIRKATANIDGVQVPTHEAVIKLPDGSVQVINAAQGLQAVDKIDKTFQRVLSAHQDARAGAHLGIAQAQEGRAAEDFKTKKVDDALIRAGRVAFAPQSVKDDPAKLAAVAAGLNADQQILRDANAALFIQNHHKATPQEIAAAQAGNVPGALDSVKQGITGALVDANRPTATPLDRAAIVNGIDPRLGADDKGNAAMALYKQYHPNATPVELQAAKQGIIKVEDAVKSRFIPSQLGGGQIEQTDKDGNIMLTEVKLDGSFGKTRTIRRPGAPEANPSSANPTDKTPSGTTIGPWSKDRSNQRAPKDQATAHAEALDAIKRGAPKDQVNARLKEFGFEPLSTGTSTQPTAAPEQRQPTAQALPDRIAKASSSPHAFATLAHEAKEQLPILKQRIQSIQRVFDTLPAEAQQIMQKTLDQIQIEAQMYESILVQQSARTGLPN